MPDNIYQVLSESDLEDIIIKKNDSLVVTMLTDSTLMDNTLHKHLKLRFFEISQTGTKEMPIYTDVFFVYVDLKNFKEDRKALD